jgi:hypothetical protein
VKKPRALIVARDPGAANALVPVAQSGPATVLAYPYASPYFRRAGLEHRRAGDHVKPAEILDEAGPEVLLTGTSMQATEDAIWWEAARARGIPSLALLDHWFNYAARFTRTMPFDSLPDRIAVMDTGCVRDMLQAGCPGDRAVVTGQPAFDELATRELAGRQRARSHWGATAADWVLLFASEPIAADSAGRARQDEQDIFSMLCRAALDLRPLLVIKLHPRESRGGFDALARELPLQVRIEADLAPRAALAGADTVVGMTSIFLLEAALSGIPVLSLQPGPEPLPSYIEHFKSFIDVAKSVPAAASWLKAPDHRRRVPRHLRLSRNRDAGFDGHAAERVWTILSIIAEGRR